MRFFKERKPERETDFGEKRLEPCLEAEATHVLVPVEVLEAMKGVEYSFDNLFKITADSPWIEHVMQKDNVIASASVLALRLEEWERREARNESDASSFKGV